MRLPVIQGLIRRRILLNYRVDPEVMQRQLPHPLRPKLQAGFAIAGVCLIRLEQLRPRAVGWRVGLSSENAAHRVAVEWTDESGETHEGVYIGRRDTGSFVTLVAGGRVFPGEHHAARFSVTERGGEIDLAMKATDGSVSVRVKGSVTDRLPEGSVFESLEEASAFFARGSAGYSTTSDPARLDGLKLAPKSWLVQPLAVSESASSWFADEARFPPGSVQLDHALLMRDIEHEWEALPDLAVQPRA